MHVPSEGPGIIENWAKDTGFYDSNQQLMFQFLDYLSGLIS